MDVSGASVCSSVTRRSPHFGAREWKTTPAHSRSAHVHTASETAQRGDSLTAIAVLPSLQPQSRIAHTAPVYLHRSAASHTAHDVVFGVWAEFPWFVLPYPDLRPHVIVCGFSVTG